MPKSRKGQRKKEKPKNKKPQSIKRNWQNSFLKIKTWSLRTWTLIVSIGTIIGFVSSLMFFASRITVSSLNSLDPSDPFSTPFSISNDGAFSIYNVEFRCHFKDVSFPRGGGFKGFSVQDDSPPIAVIEAGEKATTKCVIFAPNISIGSQGDIYVVVSYQPKFLPYRKEKLFRFIMKQGSDKQWYWFQQPVAK